LKVCIIATLLALVGGAASAAEIKVLSAGAVEPGLAAAAEAFRARTGDTVVIGYATAPALRKRLAEGERVDMVVAPPVVLDEIGAAARLDNASRVTLGKVGVGVAVRDGAKLPDISSTEALKRALGEAESIVFNQASSGLYVEKLLERLGIREAVKPRTTRYPDGAAVMEHLRQGKGDEIGFGAVTEILLYKDKGLRLVGPLPPDIQNTTSYAASASAAGANPDGAKALLGFLSREPARALLRRNGIE
jgi:molybdate transport system substrate-binding protein